MRRGKYFFRPPQNHYLSSIAHMRKLWYCSGMELSWINPGYAVAVAFFALAIFGAVLKREC
jgi:hypothetical protein